MECQLEDVWEDFDDSGMGGCVVTGDIPTPSFSANDAEGEDGTSMEATNPVTPRNVSSVSKMVYMDYQQKLTIILMKSFQNILL
jgi:hypothetical protein